MKHETEQAKNNRVLSHPWVIGLFIFTAFVLVAMDLSIKSWSFADVSSQPSQFNQAQRLVMDPSGHAQRVVVPYILNLALTTNTGAVFGSAKGAKPLFISVGVVATIVILSLFIYSAYGAWWYQLSLVFLLSGTLGNLYDRLVYSAVRDMFLIFPDIPLPFGLAWPGGGHTIYPWVFNFADVMLVAGVILLGILSWHHDKRSQTVETNPR